MFVAHRQIPLSYKNGILVLAWTCWPSGHFYRMWMRKERFKLFNSLLRSKRAQLKCALLSSGSGWLNVPTFHVSHYPYCKTVFTQSRICGRHMATKCIYFPLLGLRNTLWPGFDWGRVQPDVCWIQCHICSPYAPLCRSCRSWTDTGQDCARRNSPL